VLQFHAQQKNSSQLFGIIPLLMHQDTEISLKT